MIAATNNTLYFAFEVHQVTSASAGIMTPAVGQNYRAAVNLNNTGVALLERRCYQQAAETLVDAVATMKLVCPGPLPQDNGQQVGMTPSQTAEKLARACQRLAWPRPCETGPTTSSIECITCSDLDGLDVFYNEVLQRPRVSSAVVLAPIRIDHADSRAESIPGEGVDLDAFAIVYNLSLAYRAIGTTSTEPEAADRLRKGAMKLGQRAYCALTSLYSSEWSDFLMLSLLTSAMLHNLVSLAVGLGQINGAQEYYSRLGKAHIMGLHLLARTCRTKNAAAA